jgi:hypothetical protein
VERRKKPMQARANGVEREFNMVFELAGTA